MRYAIRQLRDSPGFSWVAIATLAITVGANTAMFSFVNGVLLRPLPYPEADRIVRVLERLPTGAPNGISTLNYIDFANENTVFEHVAAEAGWRATLTGGDEPVAIQGARVSAHYFDIFRVRAALGRTFLAGDDRPGSDRIVLLSHALWEGHFGSDAAMLGRALLLDGESYTVVGILPEGSAFDRTAAQIWAPLAFDASNMTRSFRWLAGTAKLRPGVTLEKARTEMDVIGQRLATAYPESNAGWGVAVDPLADVVIGPGLRTAVTVLFAATLAVLLIGCANLANLALARGLARQHEMAVRAALGAGRSRLVSQLLIENVVVGLCGGSLAIAVGYAMLRWIQSLIPPSALPPALDIRLDASVLLFTLALAVLTGLLFGLAPAARLTSPSLGTVLKGGGHGATPDRAGRRMQRRLVVAEIAFAFVLLVASGLMMRSFLELLDAHPGFDAANVLTAALPLRQDRHPDPIRLNGYLDSILAAVDAVPGVQRTALTSALPLQGGGYGVAYAIAGREVVSADRRRAFFKIVSPAYFETLGITLLGGRRLSDTDRAGTARVAIINDTLASREFPGESPIGHQIRVQEILPGKTALGAEAAWEVVGVIAGERITGLASPIGAVMYISHRQSPTYGLNLVVRARMPPESLQRAVRTAVQRVNEEQALSDVRTLEEIVDHSMLGNRVVNTVLAGFASIALLLAAVGIYSVTSHMAVQRTREIGIRAALGASAGSLRALLFWGGMRLTVTGVAMGLVAMLPATDVLSSMLYVVGTYDALTVAVVTAVTFAVGGVASLLPARRITRNDPLVSLRHP